MSDEVSLACNLGAIEDADAHVAVSQRVFSTVLETRESANGYEFKIPVENLNDVALWMSNERLCCPFFHFHIDLKPDGDHLWMGLSGSEHVKAMIKAEIIEKV